MLRTKIREKVRGAMWASAHVVMLVMRIAIREARDDAEQCDDMTCDTHPLSEGSAMLLGKIMKTVASHSCAKKTRDNMHRCTEGFGANREELERKALEYRSSQTRK